MKAKLLCRGVECETIHGQSEQAIMQDASTMLAGLNERELMDWTIVIQAQWHTKTIPVIGHK